MPPDISGYVHKFIPNNADLSKVVIKVLRNTYQTPSLPLQLVKQVVERAFEQTRMEMKIESSLFEEKLMIYANQLRPRYLAKINEIRKRGKKW
jgi:enoyl-CoA hydratase/carnithine racemase